MTDPSPTDQSVPDSSSTPSAPSIFSAASTASFNPPVPSTAFEHFMDQRANHLQSSINKITGQIDGIGDQLNALMNYIMQQPAAVVVAPPSSTPAPVVKEEAATPTPFQHGIRFQSDVGVNRDHTPHPVLVKIEQGGQPSPAAGSLPYIPTHHGQSSSAAGSPPHVSTAHSSNQHSGGSDQLDDVEDADDDDRAWKDVKVPLPQAFRGQLTTDSLALRSFIQRMERYMQFKQINMKNVRSLNFAVTLLDGLASQWYEGIKHDKSINSWQKLKVAMIRRFEPDDVEERETAALINTEFRTNVTAFNHEFTTHQQLAADGFRNNDQVLIHLYRIALGRAAGTSWLCTMLKAKIDTEKLTTLSQVMNATLRLEATLKQGRKSNGAATVAASSAHRPSQPSLSTPSHRHSDSSRFQRPTPVRNPQFSTPLQVNNIDAGGDDDDDMDGHLFNEIDGDATDAVDEHSIGDDDHSTTDTADGADGADGTGADSAQQSLMLNAMKAQQKFGQRYGMTPEELLRCRQNNLCFKCKRPGHMSGACPSVGNQSSKKL